MYLYLNSEQFVIPSHQLTGPVITGQWTLVCHFFLIGNYPVINAKIAPEIAHFYYILQKNYGGYVP